MKILKSRKELIEKGVEVVDGAIGIDYNIFVNGYHAVEKRFSRSEMEKHVANLTSGKSVLIGGMLRNNPFYTPSNTH